MQDTIGPGCRVTLHYALSLEDGTEVISTFDEEPLSFTLGDGTMESAFEDALNGLTRHSERQTWISGDEVFGPWQQEKIQAIPRSEFPNEMDLREGQIIGFTTPAGDELPAQIQKIDGQQVILDFNHPLAGHTINYQVRILQIES